MPTSEDMDAQIDDAIEEGANVDTAPAESTPNVSIDMDALQRNISQGIAAGFQSMMNEARRNQAHAPSSDPRLTELQISEDDDDSTRTRKMVHNAQIPVLKEFAEFRNYGLSKLTDLTSRSAASELPYYTKYKSEIDAQLTNVDPSLRADMQTLRLIHNNIVADHIDEIAEERAQQKAKATLQNSKMPKPSVGGRSSGTSEDNHVPTPEELGYSEDQIDEITRRGGPDAFARKISMGKVASWEDYVKLQKEMKAAPKKEGGRVIPFARFERGKKKA